MFFTDIVYDDALELIADKDTTLLESKSQKYFCIIQCLYQGSIYHFEQGRYDIEIKKVFVHTDPPTVCCELGRQKPDYDSSSEDNIVEMVETCADYQKLGGHVHKVHSTVQFFVWFNAFFACMEGITFENAKGIELERENAIFNQQK